MVVSTAVARKLGRKLQYPEKTRFGCAFAAVKGVSLNVGGEIYQAFRENYDGKAPSRTVVTQALVELHHCVKLDVAIKLSATTEIWMAPLMANGS